MGLVSSEESGRMMSSDYRLSPTNNGINYQTEELVFHNYQLPKDIMKHENPGEYLSR